jgi:hypothetical protein
MKKLHELVNQQQMNIVLIDTHDHNSTCCSGDIVAIQILCNCKSLSNITHTSKKHSLNALLSDDVSTETILANDIHLTLSNV